MSQLTIEAEQLPKIPEAGIDVNLYSKSQCLLGTLISQEFQYSVTEIDHTFYNFILQYFTTVEQRPWCLVITLSIIHGLLLSAQ